MSLFTSHSTANKVVDTKLNVVYSRSLVQGSWTGTTTVASGNTSTYSAMMEYHRRATMSFRYIAMTENAADTCASALKALFTRDTKFSQWNPIAGTVGSLGDFDIVDSGKIPMADVAVQRNDDGSWDVVCNVSEDDARMKKPGVNTSYDTLFATENNRKYDLEES